MSEKKERKKERILKASLVEDRVMIFENKTKIIFGDLFTIINVKDEGKFRDSKGTDIYIVQELQETMINILLDKGKGKYDKKIYGKVIKCYVKNVWKYLVERRFLVRY
jgi:hypothetical protein